MDLSHLNRFKIILSGFLIALFISGCSTKQDMMRAPENAGISKVVPYSMKRVVQASRAIIRKNWAYDSHARYSKDAFALFFYKPLSFTSWGEVGRIMIKRKGSQCRVYVHSEKRSTYQFTGTDEEEFAEQFFRELKWKLPPKKKRRT